MDEVEATADGCGEALVSAAANQETPLLIPSWEVTAIASVLQY